MPRTPRISIRAKILLIPLVGIVGFSLYLAYYYTVVSENTRLLRLTHQVNFPVLDVAKESLFGLERIKEMLNAAVGTGEAELLASTDALKNAMDERLAGIPSLDGTLTADIQTARQDLATYYDAARSLSLGMIEGSVPPDTLGTAVAGMTRHHDELKKALSDLHASALSRFTGTLTVADEAAGTALRVGLAFGFVTMIVLAVTAVSVSSLVVRNIRLVSDSLREIASGRADLTRRLAARGNDEIAELVHWFNAFVEKLESMISGIAASITQVAVAAEQLSTVANGTTDGIELQRRETELVAQAMGEMLDTIRHVARSTAEADDSTGHADEDAQRGADIVRHIIDANTTVADEVERAAEVIARLEEDTRSAAVVLDVIRTVAEQTNLLALNAAIEAARAGDNGRGFSVVADEVRALALRTQESTRKIHATIGQLQSSVRQVVDVMEIARNESRVSVRNADEGGQALQSIRDRVATIKGMTAQIAAATEEQSNVAEEIQKNVTTIQRIAGDSTAGAVQTATASDELARLSTQLQAIVGDFRTSRLP